MKYFLRGRTFSINARGLCDLKNLYEFSGEDLWIHGCIKVDYLGG